MRAAISALRTLKPARIAVAVPVASREAASAMHHEADAFLCAFLPSELYSVGEWYQEFSQTTDAEVRRCLSEAGPAGRVAVLPQGPLTIPYLTQAGGEMRKAA